MSAPPALPEHWAYVLSVLVAACGPQGRLSTPEVTSMVARRARAGQTVRATLRGLLRRGYVERFRSPDGAALQWAPTDLGRRYVELADGR